MVDCYWQVHDFGIIILFPLLLVHWKAGLDIWTGQPTCDENVDAVFCSIITHLNVEIILRFQSANVLHIYDASLLQAKVLRWYAFPMINMALCAVQGMDSGFSGGDDEVYNVYDKPWRQDKDLASNLYRPSKNLEKDVYGDDLDKLIKANRCAVILLWQVTELILGEFLNLWFRFSTKEVFFCMQLWCTTNNLGHWHIGSGTFYNFKIGNRVISLPTIHLANFHISVPYNFFYIAVLVRIEKLCHWCRFVPDKEFSGTDRSGGRREGPVQFEKDEEEDIFGLNKFLSAAKKGQKRPGVDDVASTSSKDHDRKKSRRDWHCVVYIIYDKTELQYSYMVVLNACDDLHSLVFKQTGHQLSAKDQTLCVCLPSVAIVCKM